RSTGAPGAGGPPAPRHPGPARAAGGRGSIAGAMLAPDQLRAAIASVRSLTDAPFAVNLFAPQPPPRTDRVAEWSIMTGVPLAERPPPPSFDDQLDVVVSERVAVFSFTFGIPPLAGVDAIILGTATTVPEAVALEEAGVTAVVAQGFEAGGHRGTFDRPVDQSLIGTLALVPQVVDAVSVPVIASGGIMDGRGIAAAFMLGAQGVQLGTAFLRCPEAGTSEAHRQAVGDETTITRVLTGRHARAVRTPLVDRLEASTVEPPDYPLPRYLTPDPPMLVGQAGSLSRALPAADLVAILASETAALLR
ncbi:nitronate monooxygenase, partial [Micromonospora sp. CPCC 205371]|nr:nitronate monooxygenase [Micromonospora sp. CPCC 205371]